MSNLIFVSGDFCSGTTLLFTLFRNTPGCYCLYEPLHERLPEYLIRPLRVYDHHFFVDDYFREYRGFTAVPALFDPDWGIKDLYLPSTANAGELYRYLSYLIGTAFGHAPAVVLKDNRFTFRLGWIRDRFPQAKIVHIYRDAESQWRSVVTRAQQGTDREDVGQDRVDFQGFRIAAWCEDLKATFPELAAENSASGFDRFHKLWELSRREHERHADISVGYAELVDDFDSTAARISDAVGFALDPKSLQQFVVPSDAPRASVGRRNGIVARTRRKIDRISLRLATARVERARRRR